MESTTSISDILVVLNERQETYKQELEILISERDEFHELLKIYPTLDDIVEACAEDVLIEYLRLQGKYNALGRVIDKLQKCS